MCLFSVTEALIVAESTININAQLYGVEPASNTLQQLAGSLVTLTPGLSGVISIGDTASITQAINVPVDAGTRLALVISIDVTGVAIATAITGTVSAGIVIT